MMGSVAFFNNFHVQILMVELLFCWGGARRERFWLRFLPSLALYLALPFLVPGGYFSPFVTIGGWFTLGFFVMLILSGLFLLFCFDLSWQRTVFYCCVAHTVQHAVHCLNNFFLLCFGLDFLASSLIHLCIMLGNLAVCHLLLRRHLLDGVDLERSQLLVFAAFSSGLIYVLSLWTTLKETNTIGLNLFDAFCCLELLIILFDTFRFRQAEKQHLLMLHILRQERAQHELSKANIELMNRKCHDLKHQISALRQMDSQEEKERTIGELEEAVLIYDRFAKTGNDNLDVVLTEKGLLCEQEQIMLQCIADGKRLEFMDTADIYSLFGNALDNSIEAVRSQVENPKQRIISLNITPRGNCLIIHMENTCPREPEFEDGLPVTTKGDKNYHGFGMRSMRYIAEKYDGALSARWEDGTFILDILFLLS